MIMAHQVTLDIPHAVYQRAEHVAKAQGIPIENVLVNALHAHLSTEDEDRLTYITASIESTTWWDTEGDKEWDEWTP